MKMLNLVFVSSLILSAAAMADSSIVLPGDASNVRVDSFQVTDVVDHYDTQTDADGDLIQVPVFKKGVEIHVGYQSGIEGRGKTQEQCAIDGISCMSEQNDYEGQTFEAVATLNLSDLNATEFAAANSRDASIVKIAVAAAPVPTLEEDSSKSEYCAPNADGQTDSNCQNKIAYKPGTPVTKTFVILTFNK